MMNTRELAVLTAWLLRPRLPLWLVTPIVRRRARLAASNPKKMNDAMRQMEFLLAETNREASIPEASRKYLEHWTLCSELRWHPDAVTRQRVAGIDHLIRAREIGRGVILSFAHHGHFDGAFASVGRFGIDVRVVAAADAFLPSAGPNMRQHLRVVGMGGGLLPSDVGVKGIVNRLQNGDVIAVASDVPGNSVFEFAGRKGRGSSGAARAAMLANAPVVMLTTRRDSRGSFIELSSALEPSDFASVESLLETMVRHHESAILEWPEAALAPRVCWGGESPR